MDENYAVLGPPEPVVIPDRPELTAADLEHGIANALKARDLKAVEDMLRALVAVDPVRAEAVYETLKLAVSMSRERSTPIQTVEGGSE